MDDFESPSDVITRLAEDRPFLGSFVKVQSNVVCLFAQGGDEDPVSRDPRFSKSSPSSDLIRSEKGGLPNSLNFKALDSPLKVNINVCHCHKALHHT
ncbi:unnamed protein product [Allacma fusca]|uniref:Uncharacterized protein n=1 Tax=Allacma fusca TaxID=39272 RepID=A0A8J2K205_9HEXA|nr:unnamed protein product [Allacma fusca]